MEPSQYVPVHPPRTETYEQSDTEIDVRLASNGRVVAGHARRTGIIGAADGSTRAVYELRVGRWTDHGREAAPGLWVLDGAKFWPCLPWRYERGGNLIHDRR